MRGDRLTWMACCLAVGLMAGACDEKGQEIEDEVPVEEPTDEEVVDTKTTTEVIIKPADRERVNVEADVMVNRWSKDTDGDGLPDYVETQLVGPEGDTCLVSACGKTQVETARVNYMPRKVNTMILLDASNSMASEIRPEPPKRSNWDAATSAIRRFVEIAPETEPFEYGLLVFGHKGGTADRLKQESCSSAEVIQPLSAGDAAPPQFATALGKVGPTGYTPLALAIERGAQAMPTGMYMENRLILLSDGIETCDDNPVETARRMQEMGLVDQIDVIGFDLAAEQDISTLKQIANVTGGEFIQADNVNQLQDAFKGLITTTRATEDVWMCGMRNADKVQACYTKLLADAREFAKKEVIMIKEKVSTVKTPEEKSNYEKIMGLVNQSMNEMDKGGQGLMGTVEKSLETFKEIEETTKEREEWELETGGSPQ